MLKILIVDDEADIRQILTYNLQKEGYEVYEASTGEEGIRKTKEVRIIIIATVKNLNSNCFKQYLIIGIQISSTLLSNFLR